MSPLWTEKKLVHFLSIWGPLILSHGHINSATENARAWQHSQPSVPSAWHSEAGGRSPSNAGQQDGVVCPWGWTALPRGGEIIFNTYFLFIMQFSPVGKDAKFWLPLLLLKQWTQLPREGRLAVAVGSGWGANSAKGSRSHWWTRSPVPTGWGFLGPPECWEPCSSLVAGNH